MGGAPHKYDFASASRPDVWKMAFVGTAIPILAAALASLLFFEEKETFNLILELSASLLASLSAGIVWNLDRKAGGKVVTDSLALFFGLALFSVGEAIWLGSQVIQGELPEVSVADLFWIVGSILILFFFLRKAMALVRLGTGRLWKLLLASLFALALLIAAYLFVLLPTLNASEGDLISILVNSSYIILDCLILCCLVVSAFFFIGGSMAIPKMAIALGMALIFLGDISYFLLTQSLGYSSGGLLDYSWIFGYLVLALGLFMQYAELS